MLVAQACICVQRITASRCRLISKPRGHTEGASVINEPWQLTLAARSVLLANGPGILVLLFLHWCMNVVPACVAWPEHLLLGLRRP